MKKYISVFFGLLFLFGNDAISNIFPGEAAGYVSLACALAGAVLLCYFFLILQKEFEQNQMAAVSKVLDAVQVIDKSVQDKRTEEKIFEQIKHTAETEQIRQEQFAEMKKEVQGRLAELAELFSHVDEQGTKADGDREKLVAKVEALEGCLQEQGSILKQLLENAACLNEIPASLYESTDELTEKIQEMMVAEQKLVRDLCDQVEGDIKKIARDVNYTMEGIVEILENYDGKVVENLKQLMEQYEQFQNVTNAVVENLTEMSHKDYEFMRGLLND